MSSHLDVPWGLLAIVAGLGYGFLARGRTEKWDLFKKALLWGVVLAVVLAVLGFLLGGPLGLGLLGLGAIGLVVTIVVLTLLFLLGAWVGDWLEDRMRGPPAERA